METTGTTITDILNCQFRISLYNIFDTFNMNSETIPNKESDSKEVESENCDMDAIAVQLQLQQIQIDTILSLNKSMEVKIQDLHDSKPTNSEDFLRIFYYPLCISLLSAYFMAGALSGWGSLPISHSSFFHVTLIILFIVLLGLMILIFNIIGSPSKNNQKGHFISSSWKEVPPFDKWNEV